MVARSTRTYWTFSLLCMRRDAKCRSLHQFRYHHHQYFHLLSHHRHPFCHPQSRQHYQTTLCHQFTQLLQWFRKFTRQLAQRSSSLVGRFHITRRSKFSPRGAVTRSTSRALDRVAVSTTSWVQTVKLGGRPLGFLCMWLSRHTCSKAEHTDYSDADVKYPHANRRRHRDLLTEFPNIKDLTDKERPKDAGEREEPETLAGML